MLTQRRFIINYILNNQPESIDIQTDAEIIGDEDAKKYIYETRDLLQPANITDIRIFQHAVDADTTLLIPSDEADPVNSNARRDQS